MIEAIPIAIIVLSACAGTLVFADAHWNRRARRDWKAAWMDAAGPLGLAYSELRDGWGRRPVLTGRIDGFLVNVDTSETNGQRSKTFTRISIVSARQISDQFTVEAEGFKSSVLEALGGQAIRTGDRDFDDQVRVRGDERHALAALGEEARRSVFREVVEKHAVVRRGEVYWQCPDRLKDAAAIDSRVRGLLELARSLRMTEADVDAFLVRNAMHDCQVAVRLRNLALLQSVDPKGELARQTSRAALESEAPQLRLRGAVFLGDEGLDVACSMASDAELTARWRIEALRHLAANAPPERAVPALECALSSNDSEVVRAGIAGLGTHGCIPALGRLVEIGDHTDDAETQAAAATALGRIGDVAAEPALVRWLAADAHVVEVAAIEALERVGTVSAVEPLMKLTHGVLTDVVIKRAAQQAIRQIQSRLGDVDAGRLTLSTTPDAAGALSLASSGELSMAADEVDDGKSTTDDQDAVHTSRGDPRIAGTAPDLEAAPDLEPGNRSAKPAN